MMKFEVPPLPEEGKSSEEMLKEMIAETKKEYGTDAETLSRESHEKLFEGRPEEVAARREEQREGKVLPKTEMPEGKGVETQKVDMGAYQAAYREFLLNPKKFDKKPEPKDFPLSEGEMAA